MSQINENEETEEGRFQKPERFIDKVMNGSLDILKEACMPLQLDDVAEEIDGWLSIALVNDNSAYETGQAREDLMDFCSELQLLAEAIYTMNEAVKPIEAYEWKNKLPPDLKEKMDNMNQPQLLTEEQINDPMLVVNEFCEQFTLSYCRAELWDLLDAVLTYEGEKKVSMVSLLLVYECIASVFEIAYILNQKKNIQYGFKSLN